MRGKRWLVAACAATMASFGLAVPASAAPLPDATFTASADAYVSEAAPTTAKGATDAQSCFVNDDSPSRQICYMTFTVAGLGVGDSVTAAQVLLDVKGNSTAGKTVNLSAVPSSFNESTVTWNNRPALGAQLASVSTFAFQTDAVFNVGSSTITANGTYTFAAWAAPGTMNVATNFYTKDNTAGQSGPRLKLSVDHQSAPVAVLTQPDPVNEDSVTTLTAIDSTDADGNIASYDWSFGDGSPSVLGAGWWFIDHTYANPGTYTVTVTVHDSTGLSSSDSKSIVVNAVTPPPSSVAYGMSMDQQVNGANDTWNQARAFYDSLYGDSTHKPIQRSFISGMPSASNWGNVVPTDRSAVVSFKTTDFAGVTAGNYDAQLTAFFQATPSTNKYWYTFFHEMEDNVLTSAQKSAYITAARHVVTLQRSVAPQANLIPTEIYSDFTLATSSGRNWLDWYWGDSFVVVVAWDQYNYQNADGTLNTEATKQANRASVAASHSHNDAYAVAEFPIGGSKYEDPVTGGDSVRAQWLKDTSQAYKDNGAVFVTAFDTNVGGTFASEDRPTIVAAYKTVVTSF